jgi:methionine-rich copper-binding protein CopC
VVGQTPESGSTIQAGAQEIAIEVSVTPITLDDGSGNEISVTLPDGNQLYSGCLVIQGNRGVLPVDLDQPGQHQVSWRIVSSDGHPISGDFSFQVENPAGYIADPDFQFPKCASQPSLISQAPQDFYWILFLSLGLVAGIVVLLLRPKKSPKQS